MGWLQEFKAFIQRGNVIDLAVAVIIGAAFGKIVTSLVGDIIAPVVGIPTTYIHDLVVGGEGPADPVLQHLGAFVQSVLDFLIVAFCVFWLVKAINALNVQKLLAGEPKAPELTLQEKLLAEIRDLLKAQQPAPTPPEATKPV